jgi:hypothetical protein
LRNTLEGNSDEPLQIYDIRRWRRRKRKTKRKCIFDGNESPDEVTLPVKIVGKEDIGLFFFPQHPGTTSALLHSSQGFF